MQSVLVIDDNEDIRVLLAEFLGSNGFEVVEAKDGEAGLEALRRQKFDLFLVDLVMPGKGGMEVLQEAKELPNAVPSIVITGNGSIESAVDAIRLGAFDYIEKPFNLEALRITVNRALSHQRLQKENATLKRQLSDKYDFRNIIGNSPRMQGLYRILEKISDTDSTILITGESGTGKELVAKTIHYNSSRAENPFVPINCGAIPRDLLESELFGHEKGAFTGAVGARVGRFELANFGTIFLDEIAELPFSLQVKLLRVVQEREFERIGGTRTIKVNVRILAATNRELEKAVAAGAFREDLYYRLNVIPLHIPALRERDDDIMLLFDHFMGEFCKKRRRSPLKVSPEARAVLVGYRWPGNVRELENAVERMVILNDSGIVSVDDLPEHIRASSGGHGATLPAPAAPLQAVLPVPAPWTPSGINLNAVLGDLERALILQALEKAGGVKNKAALLLGLNRTTLLEKIKKMGLSTPASVP
ncbi:MAG: two component, sigma54 specific, transcriptional regulator, Fis family [Deltaproteobacteria bacterium]|nr:two component, sigma54 specific, transcriptional regulator, Fis family [Deltaproteobacteria bacterium]